VDASELLAHLNAQSAEAVDREKAENEDSGTHSGFRAGTPASSRDAASELLRKFFKGGK
jgi:hypothetical protein